MRKQCSCENWEFIFSNLHLFLFTTLQGILSYALKGFFHINTLLSRGLKVWNISLWCTPSSSFFLWNLENQQKSYMLNSTTNGIYVERERENFKEIHTTLLFPPSTSILFPRTTNGKFSGSEGLACRRFLISSPQFFFFFSFHSLRNGIHRRICKWRNLLKILEIQMENLNKEFFSPVVKIVKRFHWINIIYKNTAISTTVESNT